jgi:hypothetical protein
MDNFNSGIYPLSMLLIIFSALLIMVFFRLFKYLLQFMHLTREKSNLVIQYLPLTELIVWTLYLSWAIHYLYVRGFLVTLAPLIIFAVIILYLAWYALKDIIAGIVFKTVNEVNLHDFISVAGISGKITAMKHTSLEIEDNSGQIISIPYSRITGNLLMRHFPSQSILSHNFRFRTSYRDLPDGVFDLMENLRLTILSFPWSSQKKPPKIVIEEENSKDILFNITVFSLEESYFTRMEKFLEKEFKGKIERPKEYRVDTP